MNVEEHVGTYFYMLFYYVDNYLFWALLTPNFSVYPQEGAREWTSNPFGLRSDLFI